MATYTDNYNLIKPTYAETADIVPLNNNFEKIDEVMHASQTSLAPAYNQTASYQPGNVVMYELNMYKCTGATSGAWDPSKWTRTTAAETGGGGSVDLDIYGEASGTAEASFSDGAEASLVECEIGIVPTQDLHGYSKPWAGGAGKNKCFNALGNVQSENAYLYPQGDGLAITINNSTRTAYAKVAQNTDIVFSCEENPQRYIAYGLDAYPDVNVLCHSLAVTQLATNQYKFNSGAYEYIAFYYCNDVQNIPDDVMIEQNTQATTFEPYSNICPISGHTDVTVTVASTSGGSGEDYTVSLGTTYYGGNLDVTTGELEVTWGNIASYAGETLTGEWLSSLDEYSTLGTPTTGAQVVYELATPLTFNLTPTQVKTLLEQNYVSHDGGGTISLVYVKGDAPIKPNPTGADIPLTGIEIDGKKFSIRNGAVKAELYSNVTVSNPSVIVLNDDIFNYDMISVRFFRDADSIPENSVYITIDTQLLEINQTISFIGWAGNNEFVLYKLTSGNTLSLVLNGSRFYIRKITGIRY